MVADNVLENAEPSSTDPRLPPAVDHETDPLVTVIKKFLVAEFPNVSDAVSVKLDSVSDPTSLAVPVIAPVEVLRLNPLGNEPEVTLYEIVPSVVVVAETVIENASPSSTSPKLPPAVDHETDPLVVVIVKLLDAELPKVSEAVIEKVTSVSDPTAGAVPDISPVELLRLNPLGNDPVVTA